MSEYSVVKIKRVVVLLHAGGLSVGSVVPLAFTDSEGEALLSATVKYHTDAGARIIYDGPPNQPEYVNGSSTKEKS